MSEQFRDDPDRERFELDVDGLTAFAVYRRRGDDILIRHVEAPPPLRGTGAAGRLMAGIVEHARREGVRLVPLCSYAAAWLRRHPEHRDVLGGGVTGSRW